MKKRFFSLIMLFVLLAVLTAAVCAEDGYTFTLTVGMSFKDEAQYWYADLTAPVVSGMADEKDQARLNAYFENRVTEIRQSYYEDAAYMEENYKDDEFMPRFGYEYSYSVITDSPDYFVFGTMDYMAAGSSMTVNEFWTLDKHTGELVRIKDLLDPETLKGIPAAVYAAMEEENKNAGTYWTENAEVSVDIIDYLQHWYINEDGDLVVTFDKYEIAPGAAGESRFIIKDGKATLIRDDKYDFDLYVGDTFEEETKNWYVKLSLPVIGGMADAAEQDMLNKHFADTFAAVKKDFEEAKEFANKAVEEGNEPHFGYDYGYTILTYNNDILAFKTTTGYVAASYTEANEYWTLSRATGKLIPWDQVVTDEAVALIREQVLAEMAAMNEAGEGAFYLEDDSVDTALANLDKNHHWYLNDEGKLVVGFDKYEVAAGVQGAPEFVIDLTAGTAE